MTTVVRAPGKLLLLGEYAVLEGAPAIVAAVNRYVEVRVHSRPQPPSLLRARDIGITELPFDLGPGGEMHLSRGTDPLLVARLRLVRCALAAAGRVLGDHQKPLRPLCIDLNSSELNRPDDGVKLGLGSSAAVVTALVQSLFANSGLVTAETDQRGLVFETALAAHRAAQSRLGSGVDVAASTFGGVLRYQLLPTTEAVLTDSLGFPEGLHMLVVWSGESASTPAMLTQVSRLRDTEPTRYHELMESLGQIAAAGAQAFADGAVARFLDHVDRYRLALDALGQEADAPIVNAPHAQLATLAARFGAAYKPSGAGGGDLGLAFTQSENDLDRLAKAVFRAGFHQAHLDIERHGVHLAPRRRIDHGSCAHP